MKILLTGGSGLLGQELLKINPDINAPEHGRFDINHPTAMMAYLDREKPDLIIHAAAITDNRYVEKEPVDAVMTNIVGTAFLARECFERNIRLVYLSTDYIYKGDRGNFRETDEILPFNLYSWTKLGGECSVKIVRNHLIIRTSFGENTFDYPIAFTDKWSSKQYVDQVAPLILEAALSPLTGILNVGGQRKSLYDYATERNMNVRPKRLADTPHLSPYDTSLNLQKLMDYKQGTPVAKPHTACRICGKHELKKYLDLELMPLANNLEFTAQRAREKERYPLQVMYCDHCGLSQLSVVIDPEKMFSYYTYRSSVNKGYVKHCRQMAKELKLSYGLTENHFIIDIAGNDGALLKEFSSILNCKVLNVDPATNLTPIAEAQGIPCETMFWNFENANDIVAKYGKADLITATNVFAHVDDIIHFMDGVSEALQDNGILVLEFPYLVDFIENMEFDTVYFEHLSYVSILPLVRLCGLTGLKIIDVVKQDIHGGTVRVVIAKHDSERMETVNVHQFINTEIEKGYNKFETYANWSDQIKMLVDDFSTRLLQLKREGNKIAAFAASAKGNTLLNAARIGTDIIDYIVDDTPEKIAKFSPGTGIPIVNARKLVDDLPDYVVILSWNFVDEIINRCKPIYKGKYIIPIPEFCILEQ